MSRILSLMLSLGVLLIANALQRHPSKGFQLRLHDRCLLRKSISSQELAASSIAQSSSDFNLVRHVHRQIIDTTVAHSLRVNASTGAGLWLLLCVSGGSDSMAMMHLLSAVRQQYMPELHLEVIHFNHKQREESEMEVRCLIDALT